MDLIGQTLAHYKVLRKLGQGGMGEVYLAEDTELGRNVALKLLPSGVSEDPQRLERFRREAKALAALNHPGIVTIYSVEEDHGCEFLCMEAVEGRTLGEIIPEQGFDLSRLLKLAIPLAEALSAAHGRGVTHRDLKPSNVMVSSEDQIKVLDFGLAQLRSDEEKTLTADHLTEALTQEGVLIGTLPYMSPEQAQGKPLDNRTDLFSLGIILHEMATGSRPFSGAGPAQLLSSILRDRPTPVHEIKPTLPVALGKLIQETLARSPGERIQSAAILTVRLRELRKVGEAAGGSFEPSIAVLAFADMSPEKDQDYFCEGMAEEIINSLAKIKGLHVASRTSAFQFKAAAVDSQEIGRRLGVNTFLEGSVRKAGRRLRISAQLINAADGYHLWSERFDREMEDVFSIQDEIAQAVVDTLKVKLLGPAQIAVKRSKGPDISAYNLNLKGRYFWNQRSEDGLKKAITYFKEAIERDPSYAPAYASLADTYSLLCAYHFLSPADSIPLARAAASRALEIDNNSAEAHEAVGHVKLLAETNWDQAESDYRTAIELNDSFATAHQRLALLYTVLGRRGEADLAIGRAQKLDPLSLIIQTDGALLCLIEGDPGVAIARCNEVLEMSPQFGVARFVLGLALEEEGCFDGAAREFEAAGEASGADTIMAAAHGHALARSGDESGAIRILDLLDEMPDSRFVSPYSRAVVLAGLGRDTEAVGQLSRALEEKSVWQIHLHLKVDPRLRFLRSHPEFESIEARLRVGQE